MNHSLGITPSLLYHFVIYGINAIDVGQKEILKNEKYKSKVIANFLSVIGRYGDISL